MHTSDLCLDQCHRLFSKPALALAGSCLATAPRTQLDRVRAVAMPVIANAWIAAMGQPSPMTGFALVVMAELGGCLLRLPAVRAAIFAAARSMATILAGLTFQMSAQRQGPAAPDASRPAFILKTLCAVKQPRARAGYHSAGGRPQCNALHPPRRTS
jgi:hypothetical protein